MRPQQNRRIRGRGNNNNNSNGNGNNRRNPNPLTRNYESNGPDVRIRGNAQHIADKYAALARDVLAAGDRVMAENYLQHAEHYMRIILSAQPQFVQPPKIEPIEGEDSANIVDLPLNEANSAQENLLHLIVNREAETQITEEPSEEEGENTVSAPQEAKPKMERVRRMTRRRLPRQAQNEGGSSLESDENSNHDASFLPAFITESQDRLENLAAAQPSQQDPATVEIKKPIRRVAKPSDDLAEKPRRKRRIAKSVDEEMQD